jgi:hypothetical protein
MPIHAPSGAGISNLGWNAARLSRAKCGGDMPFPRATSCRIAIYAKTCQETYNEHPICPMVRGAEGPSPAAA